MNIWKLTSIGVIAGLVVTIGIQAAAEESPGHGSRLGAGPCDGQPNMQAALRSLSAASDSLQAALPDKRGHRTNAMALISSAIGEVQAGCTAGGG